MTSGNVTQLLTKLDCCIYRKTWVGDYVLIENLELTLTLNVVSTVGLGHHSIGPIL